MRTSEPYIEIVEGITDVQAGDRVERDDGWWRAYRVTCWAVSLGEPPHESEIEWRPDPAPDAAETLGEVVG